MAALLLDENMPASAGAELALAGHDVAWVSRLAAGTDDPGLLALARTQSRIFVTFDADFGELIFARRVRAPAAVVYVRMHPVDAVRAVKLVAEALLAPCEAQFVACSPDGIRRHALPGDIGG
jgi:predicted nuclease of predicted toxin-antitoxin system